MYIINTSLQWSKNDKICYLQHKCDIKTKIQLDRRSKHRNMCTMLYRMFVSLKTGCKPKQVDLSLYCRPCKKTRVLMFVLMLSAFTHPQATSRVIRGHAREGLTDLTRCGGAHRRTSLLMSRLSALPSIHLNVNQLGQHRAWHYVCGLSLCVFFFLQLIDWLPSAAVLLGGTVIAS